MTIRMKAINLSGTPNTERDKFIQLPEVANASLPAASATNEGGIVYDTTSNTVRFSDGGSWANIDSSAAASTADDIYNNAAWSVAVDANDITWTLATGYNMLIKAAAAGTTDVGLEINDNATGTLTDGLLFTAANSIVDAIDASAANITNAINIGANTIKGTTSVIDFTNFDVDASGNLTAATLTAGTGLTVTTGNATLSAGNLILTNGTASLTDAVTTSGTAFTFDPSLVTTGTGLLVDGTSVTSGDAIKIHINSDTMTSAGSALSVVDMKTSTEVFAIRDDGTVLMKGTAEGTTAAQIQSGDLVISDGDLTVSGGETTLITDADAVMLTVRNTNAGTTGVQFNLQHDSTSPANSDVITRINFVGDDNGGTATNYARIDSTIVDVTDTSEDGRLGFSVMVNGTLTEQLRLDSVGVSLLVSPLVVGTGSADATIKSNGNYDLILQTGNATTGKITIADGAAGSISLAPDTIGVVEVLSADAGTVGASLDLYQNSASPANADEVAILSMYGKSSTGVKRQYGKVGCKISDITNTSEDAQVIVSAITAGAVTQSAVFTGLGVLLGSGVATGILQSSGDFDLTLQTGNATSSKMTITDGAAGSVTFDIDSTGEFVITNDDAGALGSVLTLYHNSASPANADVIGRIRFDAKDSGAGVNIFGQIDSVITDVTAGNEDGDLLFKVMRAGTLTTSLTIDSDVNGVLIGDGAADGIVQSSGNFDLILRTGNAATSRIQIQDGAAGTIALVADTTGVVEVYNAEAGAVGAQLSLYQESASPAAMDAVGTILFQGEDSVSSKTLYADVRGVVLNTIDGTEDAVVTVRAITLGVLKTSATFGGGKVIVGDAASAGTLQSDGNFDLILQTGNATTGTIRIVDGVAGAITLTPNATGEVVVQSTDGGALGSVLRLTHQGGSQANADVAARILFTGEDNAVADEDYAKIDVVIDDVTAANPAATMKFYVDAAGTLTQRLSLGGNSNGIVVGDGTATGLVASNGNYDLQLQTGNATTGKIIITDGAAGAITLQTDTTGVIVIGSGANDGTLQSNGNYDLILKTGNAVTGSITIVDGAGGNISLAPNGVGVVTISTSLNIGASTAVSSVLDEDNMVSDSNTALATQQSIKAYVDAQVAAVNTLQEVFDNGTSITIANTDNQTLVINQDDVTNDPDALQINNAGTGDEIQLTRTDSGALGVVFHTIHTGGSQAASDVIARWQATGQDDAAAAEEYGRIDFVVTDSAAANPDSEIQALVNVAGTVTKRMTVATDINGIRVGSGAAAGVVSSDGSYDLTLQTGNAATGTISIVDGANNNIVVAPNGSGSFKVEGETQTSANIGAVAANVTAVEYGNGRQHTTVLTVTAADTGGIAGAGAEAQGVLLYTLPAGAIALKVAYMSVAVQGDAAIQADTPDVGVGTGLAAGAVATLNLAGAGAEDVITGQTAANANGTATVKTIVNQALAIEVGDAHTIYFNVADTWAGASVALPATGTVVLEWTFLA